MSRVSRTKPDSGSRLLFRKLRRELPVEDGKEPESCGQQVGTELRRRSGATHQALPASSAQVTFSQELGELAARFSERPVQLGEILDATRGRGVNLLLVFISLPFLTPIPLPGFSIPFGLVVSIIGARTALGQNPWLPQKLLRCELPPRLLFRLLKAATRVVKWLEWFLRPRLAVMNDSVISRRLAGALITISGLFLVIPLPVPFSNSLPACTVLLLAAGALERDGLAFLAGCGLFMVTTAFFLLLAFGGVEAMRRLQDILIGG
jgi:hypothetical protein